MKIEVGTRVKITGGYSGEFIGREGVVTSDEYMVASIDGLPEHRCVDGEFHLHFTRDCIEPIAKTLTIEPGKCYRTRDGRKVGPMTRWINTANHPFEVVNEDGNILGRCLWGNDGKCDELVHLDLIAEWTEDDDLNAICDERKDGPFNRDPELTSPYGDGNHPLPDDTARYKIKPELADFPLMGPDKEYTPTMTSDHFFDKAIDRGIVTGTLADLQVKPGDVVEACWQGDGGWEEYKYVLKHPNYGHECLLSTRDDIGYIKIEDADQWEFRIISSASDGDPVSASDTPKTWGEMTDSEKGALLLAWQRGVQLQYWDHDNQEWEDTDIHPFEFEADAYRIKPEHKREKVTLYHGPDDTAAFTGYKRANDDVVITYTRSDGKPDLDSIKMEEV